MRAAGSNFPLFVPFSLSLHLLSPPSPLRRDSSISRGFLSYLIKQSGCRPCGWLQTPTRPTVIETAPPTDSLCQTQANLRPLYRVVPTWAQKKKKIIVKEENSARACVAKRRDGYSASARYTLQRCAIAALQQAQSITTLQSLHSPHSLRFPLHSLHWGEWACAHVLSWLLELSIRDKTLRIAQLLCTGLLHLAVSSPSSVIQVESRSSCLHLPAGLRSALAVWLVSGGLKVAVQAWIDV